MIEDHGKFGVETTEVEAGTEESLALARFGGFLHLPFFGYDGDVQQAKRQNHHHENECHGEKVMGTERLAKITPVPAG
jgi:hypothetical protein